MVVSCSFVSFQADEFRLASKEALVTGGAAFGRLFRRVHRPYDRDRPTGEDGPVTFVGLLAHNVWRRRLRAA